MMKANSLNRIWLIALFLIPIYLQVYGTIDVGIRQFTNAGDPRNLMISYKANDNYNSNPFNTWNSQLFTMRWSTSLGSGVITGTFNQANYNFATDGSPSDGGDGFFYQKFTSSSSNVTQNFNNGQTIDVLRISLSHPSIATGTFELVTLPNTWVANNNGAATVENAVLGNVFNQFDPSIASNVPLPVTLLSFTAQPQRHSIRLAWQSAGEINFDAYELQRSTDGEKFETIARITGKGSSSQGATYTYEDKEVQPGITYYYRLKMMDNDGKFEYSPVRSASIASTGNEIKLYPNPTGGELFLEWQASGENELRVEVFKETSERVLLREYPITQGTNRLPIDARALPPGFYLLRAVSPSRAFSQKFYRLD